MKSLLRSCYLLLQGPVTNQERWEKNAGNSPSMLAPVIACLVCAAEYGKEDGQTQLADFILTYADRLAAILEECSATIRSGLVEGSVGSERTGK